MKCELCSSEKYSINWVIRHNKEIKTVCFNCYTKYQRRELSSEDLTVHESEIVMIMNQVNESIDLAIRAKESEKVIFGSEITESIEENETNVVDPDTLDDLILALLKIQRQYATLGLDRAKILGHMEVKPNASED